MQFGGQSSPRATHPLGCPRFGRAQPLYEPRQRPDERARCWNRPEHASRDRRARPRRHVTTARSGPRSRPVPTAKTGGNRFPWPVAVGDLMPLRTVLGPPHDAVDHLTVITPPATTLRFHPFQTEIILDPLSGIFGALHRLPDHLPARHRRPPQRHTAMDPGRVADRKSPASRPDVTFREDSHQARTGNGPAVMATLVTPQSASTTPAAIPTSPALPDAPNRRPHDLITALISSNPRT